VTALAQDLYPAIYPSVTPKAPLDQDQLVVIHGVDWKTYCAVRELFDGPALRLTYLNGALEIMSPSRKHEGYKTRIARLLELFALERDVPLLGYGSTTFKKAAEERGLEPDECYVLGRDLNDDEYPDIALEVVLSSGGLNKLAVYRGLGVQEVWFWLKGRFEIYSLEASGYVRLQQSNLIPGLDFNDIATFAELPDQHAALKSYRQKLQSEPSKQSESSEQR
jgi:Uma2 family endonuclease